MRRARGFTLIELMIVVAIIAVLAAIAIPQYQTYVAKSQVSRAVEEASSQRIVVDMCRLGGGDTIGVGACMPTATGSDILDGASQVTGVTLPDGTGVPQITLTDDAGGATIVAKLGNHVSTVIDGETATWTRDDSGNWTCAFSGAAKYAPASCPGT